MPQSIPVGITAEAVRSAAASLDAGYAHPFGPPTNYEAIVDGRQYPPKALIGLAAKHQLGLDLGPTDFRGGERPGEANWYLRRLGFDVFSKETRVGEDWTDDEIWAAIHVYFGMLVRKLRGERYVKAWLLRDLAARTHGRSAKSAEYKLQNISAVLLEMGLTRLDGLTPASNYQARLVELVDEYLSLSPELLSEITAMLESAPSNQLAAPGARPRRSIEDTAPVEPPTKKDRQFKPRRLFDRAKRDAANRELGQAGERFVVAMERETLTQAGRADLAARVRWVADVDGDGAGYDVLSFEESGTELFIEVKTTNGAKETPFFVTSNELEFSATYAASYRLYRVFGFSSEARLYVLQGNVQDAVQVEPTVYRATFRSTAPAETSDVPASERRGSVVPE